MWEITPLTGIPKSSVHEIWSELGYRKVSARWVPKLLTNQHKIQRMKKGLLESIVTGDETWVYTNISKNSRWRDTCEFTNQVVCTKDKGNWVLGYAMHFAQFLPPKTTININKSFDRNEKGMRLLYDDAKPHTSNETKAWLQKHYTGEVIVHPPHSPGLATSNFCLFGPLKVQLSGKRFEDDDERHFFIIWIASFTKVAR